MTTEVGDAEIVPEEGEGQRSVGRSLEKAVGQDVQSTLLRTDDPLEVIEKATKIADKLKDVLKRQGLTSRIGNKDHVNVEGWQTVGAMLGVNARKEWVKAIEWPEDKFLTDPLRKQRDRGMVFGYEAGCFAQTLGGIVVGAAEATCKRTEVKWTTSDDYAIESMAQTRATSKALGSVLRWIVTLAGYSGTPAEEMPDGHAPAGQSQPPRQPRPAALKQRLSAAIVKSGLTPAEASAVRVWWTARCGKRAFDRLTVPELETFSAQLEAEAGAQVLLAEISARANEGDQVATTLMRRIGGES